MLQENEHELDIIQADNVTRSRNKESTSRIIQNCKIKNNKVKGGNQVEKKCKVNHNLDVNSAVMLESMN